MCEIYSYFHKTYTNNTSCSRFLYFLATILYLSESNMKNSMHKPYQFGRKINLHQELPSSARQISSASVNLIPVRPIKNHPLIRKPKSQHHKTIQYQQKLPKEPLVKTQKQLESIMHYTPEKLLGLNKQGGEDRVKFIEKIALSPKEQVELLKLSLRYVREENEDYLRHRASTIKHKIKNKFKGSSDPQPEIARKSTKPKLSPQARKEEIGKYNEKFQEYLIRKNILHNRYHTVVSEDINLMPANSTIRNEEGKSSFRKVFRTLPDVPTEINGHEASSSFFQNAPNRLPHEDLPAIARMLLNSQQIPQNQILKRSSLLTPGIKKSNHLIIKSPCGLREHFDSLEERYLNNCTISQGLQINTHREKHQMSPHFIKGSINQNLIRKNVRYFKKDILPHLVREVSQQSMKSKSKLMKSQQKGE